MLKASKTRVADVHGTMGREERPGTRVAPKTAFLMTTHNLEVGDVRRRPKHRSSCSTVEEDLAATVIDGSALPAVDSHPNCIAIGKAHPRSGLSRSDFVPWHRPTIFVPARSYWRLVC